MDFPDFFTLTKVNDFIMSGRWRGIAVLTSPVNAGQQLDEVDPVTGDRCTDRDVALHVLTKPLLWAIATPTIGGVTILAAKPGVRYYIHSVTLSVRLIAADTTTGINCQATRQGTQTILANLSTVPSAASAAASNQIVDVLADENTAVLCGAGAANPTDSGVIVTYAEIGAK